MRSICCLVALMALTLLGPRARAQPGGDPMDVLMAGAPADVRAIMKKATSGQELTEAEQKRLEEYMTKAAGGLMQQAKTASAKADKLAAGVKLCGKPKPSKERAPSDGAYRKLLKTLLTKYRKAAGKDRARVDKMLAGKPPADAINLGGVLQMWGAPKAAAYATLLGLERAPERLLGQANLGAILGSLGESKPALQLLLRADARAPGSDLIAGNLGWALIHAGDCAAARKAFESARSKSPRYGPALRGLGQILLAEGKPEEANRIVQQAAGEEYSPPGDEIENETRDDVAVERLPPPPRLPDHWPPPDPLPELDPPVGVGIDGMVGRSEAGRKWHQDLGEVVIKRQRQLIAATGIDVSDPGAERTPRNFTKRFGDARAVSLFFKHYRYYDRRVHPRLRDIPARPDVRRASDDYFAWYHQSEGQELAEAKACTTTRCTEAVARKWCNERRGKVQAVIAKFEQIWPVFWGETKQDMKAMWIGTGRALRGVATPETFELLEQFRSNILYNDLLFVSTTLEVLRAPVLTCSRICTPEPGPGVVLPALPVAAPRPCDSRTSASVSIAGVVEVEVDCEKMKSEFTIGVDGLPAGQVAVEENTRTGESTFYFGAQLETPGAVKIEGKAGSFVKTDAGGEIVDGGWYQGRALKTPLGEAEVGVEVGVSGIEVKWTTGSGGETPGGTGGMIKSSDSLKVDWPK